jgi:hypothetical protein
VTRRDDFFVDSHQQNTVKVEKEGEKKTTYRVLVMKK